MFSKPYMSSPEIVSKPRIVGLIHNSSSHLNERENSAMLAEERARVLRALDKMPAGTRVGIELTPSLLEAKSEGWPGDIFAFVIREARHRKLNLVLLDTELRWKKHLQIFSLLSDLNKLRGTPAWTDKLRDQYFQVQRNYIVHTYTRSLGMGLKLKSGKLPLSFIGAGHAFQLTEPLSKTHEVELPTKGKKALVREFRFFEEVFSRSENKGLEPILRALLNKRLLETK